MTIRLTLLGGLRAFDDELELDWLGSQRLRAALFVYLAVERRVSRTALLPVFWPERDERHARQALRQSVYHLRKMLGGDWLETSAQELRAGRRIRTDVEAFETALERGEPELAARLYDGAFLDGVHLVDLKAFESWVDGRRLLCARGFRRACRAWVEQRRAAGDAAGAIAAAQRWAAPDPFDDEAQHALIEALAAAGERTESIRQFEAYARLLEPEGLRPLESTVALVERIRSTPAVPPSGTDAAEPSAPRPGNEEAPPPAGSLPQARGSFRLRGGRLRGAAAAALVVLAVLWLRHPTERISGSSPGLAPDATSAADAIVLADFEGPVADHALGSVVTDALRMDLLEAGAVRVLDEAEVRLILERMQVRDATALNGGLAREVALRSGVKAVLEGGIAQAGTGYVLTAALRAADSDRVLAAFRETARTPDDVIPAIDRLSREIRKRAGSTLPSIAGVPAPERVTTASLEALRAYTEAERAFAANDRARGLALLEEAVALDPEFAMAWRALGLRRDERDARSRRHAVTRAYDLRQRLSPRERYLAEAAYRREVEGDHAATIDAYRRVLQIAPDDGTALHNLALRYRWMGDFEAAAALLERATAQPDVPVTTHLGLIYTRLAQGSTAQARAAVDALARRSPADPALAGARFWIDMVDGDATSAAARVEPLLDAPRLSATQRMWLHEHHALAALWQGRVEEARTRWERAEQVARAGGADADAFASRLRRAEALAMVSGPASALGIVHGPGHDSLRNALDPSDRSHHVEAGVFGMLARTVDVERVLRAFEAEVPEELRSTLRSRTEAAGALVLIHRGDAAAAVRVLEGVRASHPCRFCLAWLIGEALAEAGRPVEAAREWESALDWKDELFDGLPVQVARNLWILERLPRLYEQLGDTARALHHYGHLVDLWRDADPALQSRVVHARARIAKLERRGAAAASVPADTSHTGTEEATSAMVHRPVR